MLGTLTALLLRALSLQDIGIECVDRTRKLLRTTVIYAPEVIELCTSFPEWCQVFKNRGGSARRTRRRHHHMARVLLIKWLTQDRCVARDVILPGGSGEMTSNRDERRRGVPRLSVDMFYHHPSPTAGEIEIILPS